MFTETRLRLQDERLSLGTDTEENNCFSMNKTVNKTLQENKSKKINFKLEFSTLLHAKAH